jgi:hypothetical protein
MNRAGTVLTVAGMLAAAFLGGAAAQWAKDAGSVHAQESDAARTVRAGSFVVVGADGNERAILGSQDGGVTLRVADAEGNDRMVLGMLGEGDVGTIVRSAEGKDVVVLGAFGKAHYLDLYDTRGEVRMQFGTEALGESCGLALTDIDGTKRISAGIGAGGGCDLTVTDRRGNKVWSASDQARGE